METPEIPQEAPLKFVHTADTHLGFEITKTAQSDPRGRKSRADAIFQNFVTVVEHAIEIESDLFIHSGDLFNNDYTPGDILSENSLLAQNFRDV